jgi:hypothetical protein
MLILSMSAESHFEEYCSQWRWVATWYAREKFTCKDTRNEMEWAGTMHDSGVFLWIQFHLNATNAHK